MSLREERDFLELVIDAVPNFIFVKDWEGRFRLVNKAIAEPMGPQKRISSAREMGTSYPMKKRLRPFLEMIER